jgi:transposase
VHRTYTEAIKHYCPNATLVIDHFHVTKALTEAVDEVRKNERAARARYLVSTCFESGQLQAARKSTHGIRRVYTGHNWN